MQQTPAHHPQHPNKTGGTTDSVWPVLCRPALFGVAVSTDCKPVLPASMDKRQSSCSIRLSVNETDSIALTRRLRVSHSADCWSEVWSSSAEPRTWTSSHQTQSPPQLWAPVKESNLVQQNTESRESNESRMRVVNTQNIHVQPVVTISVPHNPSGSKGYLACFRRSIAFCVAALSLLSCCKNNQNKFFFHSIFLLKPLCEIVDR